MNMKDGCFTKQVAKSLTGVNDGGYFGLDFKADKTNMIFYAKEKFYSELISINNTMAYDFQINEESIGGGVHFSQSQNFG